MTKKKYGVKKNKLKTKQNKLILWL
jgi:hypothetical protein